MKTKNELAIYQTESGGLELSVDNGKTYIDVYGSVKIPNCCLINCTDKEARKTIVIEVTTE